MASLDFNSVTLAGRLASDVDVRNVGNAQVAVFKFVTNRNFKNKDGEWQSKPMFIRCEAWEKLAERVQEKCKKGGQVLISGSLELDEWEKDGQKRSEHKVKLNTVQAYELVKGAQASEDSEEEQAPPQKGKRPSSKKTDDDLPF